MVTRRTHQHSIGGNFLRTSASTWHSRAVKHPSQECDDEGAETGLATGQPPVPLEVIAGTSPDLEARKWRSTQSRGRFPRESGPAGEGGARPPFEERVGALTGREYFCNNNVAVDDPVASANVVHYLHHQRRAANPAQLIFRTASSAWSCCWLKERDSRTRFRS